MLITKLPKVQGLFPPKWELSRWQMAHAARSLNLDVRKIVHAKAIGIKARVATASRNRSS